MISTTYDEIAPKSTDPKKAISDKLKKTSFTFNNPSPLIDSKQLRTNRTRRKNRPLSRLQSNKETDAPKHTKGIESCPEPKLKQYRTDRLLGVQSI